MSTPPTVINVQQNPWDVSIGDVLKPDVVTPQPSEHETASWWEWPIYSWIGPLLTRGAEREAQRHSLTDTDLLRLPTFENPCINQERFRLNWRAEVERCAALRKADPVPVDATPEQAETWHEPSLAWVLWQTYKKHVIIGSVLRVISDGCTLASPFILRQFITWMNADEPESGEGWGLLAGLVLLQVCMSTANSAATHHTLIGFEQMRSTCLLEVFEGALRFPAGHQSTGLLLSAHASDTSSFVDFAALIHGLWVSPLVVLGAVGGICAFVGWAGLACFGLMMVFSPSQGIVMKYLFGWRRQMMGETDKRVSAVNECLQGIRICKFMSWEENFSQRIADARSGELHFFSRIIRGRALLQAFMQAIPAVFTFFLFAVSYLIDKDQMNASNVFPALTMLNALRSPLMFIPQAYAKVFDVQLACRRIQRIMTDASRQDYAVTHESGTENSAAIVMKDITVVGRGNQIVAPNLSLSVPSGALVIVLGATASGKSTLVKALIGEATIDPTKGELHHYGSIALVPQEPWIMNGTVRDNIVLDLPFDSFLYFETVRACQLEADFQQMPQRDLTEIGERGVNVSGGQKQRIAFARAVYSERSIVVMDDPLSAVDAHVSASLFDDCICGALAGRTRVFVTHQSQLLPRADYAVLMEDCQIKFAGTIDELRATGYYVAPAEIFQSSSLHITASLEHNEDDAPMSPTMQVLGRKAFAPAHSVSVADTTACAGRGLMTMEESATGSVPWATYGWYVELGGVGNFAGMSVVALAAQAGFTIANLILARWSSMQPVISGLEGWSHIEYLQWMGVFTAGGLVFLAARQIVYARFVTSVARNLHDAVARNILRAPTFFFDTTPMGRIINRFTKDMSTVDSSVSETLGSLLNMITMLLGTVFLVCYSSVWLILIFPPIVLVFVLVYRYYTKTVRGIKRLDTVSLSPMLAIMNEVVGGLSSIRIYRINQMLIRTHEERVLAALRPGYNMRCAQRWLGSRTELLGAVIVFFCALLGVLSRTTLKDSLPLSPSVVALAISNAISTTNTITTLTRAVAALETDMASTQRLQQYSDDIPQEATLNYADEEGAPAHSPTRPEADWPAAPDVKFENFDLRYRPGLPLILCGINVVFESRHKIGVVGRTASGKSTMLLAMFRMIEAAGGKISIGGRDISTMKLKDLRRAITIIPQDPLLFRGTIRSNLDPFHEHSDEAVWVVIDRLQLRARLTTFIEEGPSGLDTPVAERGSNFSLGQRQLLCMARALLKRSPILMLDEATASVDFETDAMIQHLIREEFRSCTVVTIAHRLATIMDSDRVLVLSHGEVAEFGKPAELLRRSDGHFFGMVRRLGPDQFDALVEVAEGRAAVAGSILQMDTVYSTQ